MNGSVRPLIKKNVPSVFSPKIKPFKTGGWEFPGAIYKLVPAVVALVQGGTLGCHVLLFLLKFQFFSVVHLASFERLSNRQNGTLSPQQ